MNPNLEENSRVCTVQYVHSNPRTVMPTVMQNQTIFVKSMAILDMKKLQLRVCYEIQKYSLCNEDSEYVFKYFLAALV